MGLNAASRGGLRSDQAVGAEVLRVLKPLGIDAAIKAAESLDPGH
jgi:hypothetical protein